MEIEELKELLQTREKEIRSLNKKLSLCLKQREELQTIMEHSRKLLESVLQEETLNQLTMFRKFVPIEFLETLGKKNILDIQLGDHVELEMTILSSDIRSFATLSETMSSEDNFKFINAFLKRIEPPIHDNKGFIDKFIGDAVMALFYTSDQAIDAGIAMQKSIRNYNELRSQNSFASIKIGVGLHTGLTTLGIVGVENRLQGTVIADAVNLASRIESLTKLYGSALLVSGFTLSRIQNAAKYRHRYLGKVRVPGKSEINEIYEILDAEEEEIGNLKFQSKDNLELGLRFFFEKKFPEASVEFSKALAIFPTDKASNFYFKQCAEFMIQGGVSPNWDGAVTHIKHG